MPEGFDPYVELARICELKAKLLAKREEQKLAQSLPDNQQRPKDHASHDESESNIISSRQTT